MTDSSIFSMQLRVPTPVLVEKRVALITTCGFNNFHHWNYDCLPRFSLLKQAGLLESIDCFIIANAGLPFQRESLELLGIAEEKIINPAKRQQFSLKASQLLVPSLPEALGTISPWVVNFLNQLYKQEHSHSSNGYSRIYLSRKSAPTRKIINQAEFNTLLNEYGFKEILPEDHSVREMAAIMAGAEFILSIHGSSLSNLCFISPKTKVIDILAPFHQDAYYWMITNIRGSKYIGFFGEGSHPPDEYDLVKNKVDKDIQIDIKALKSLLDLEVVKHETI